MLMIKNNMVWNQKSCEMNDCRLKIPNSSSGRSFVPKVDSQPAGKAKAKSAAKVKVKPSPKMKAAAKAKAAVAKDGDAPAPKRARK